MGRCTGAEVAEAEGNGIVSTFDQTPEVVADALRGVVIEHGLRRAEVVTDRHVIVIEEPGLWSDERDLKTTVREIDL